MKIKLRDIFPNPHRRMESYPIKKDKLAALKGSIQQTDWWENVVVRRSPTQKGMYELAYGHHRLAALRELYSPGAEFGFIVRKLSDDDMLRMMASENMEEWGSGFWVTLETVRALLDAKANGGAEGLDVESTKGRGSKGGVGRFALNVKHPGSGRGASSTEVWVVPTHVAAYFNWHEPSGKPKEVVGVALNALRLIEAGHLTEDQFRDLGCKQARTLVRETTFAETRLTGLAKKHETFAKKARAKGDTKRARAAEMLADKARRQAKAAPKTAAKSVAASFKRGESTEDATATARRITWSYDPYKEPPRIDDYATSLARKLNKVLSPEDTSTLTEGLVQVANNSNALEPLTQKALKDALGRLAHRADMLRGKIEGGNKLTKTQTAGLVGGQAEVGLTGDSEADIVLRATAGQGNA